MCAFELYYNFKLMRTWGKYTLIDWLINVLFFLVLSFPLMRKTGSNIWNGVIGWWSNTPHRLQYPKDEQFGDIIKNINSFTLSIQLLRSKSKFTYSWSRHVMKWFCPTTNSWKWVLFQNRTLLSFYLALYFEHDFQKQIIRHSLYCVWSKHTSTLSLSCFKLV